MLTALIRPVETHTVTLKGEDLAEVRAQLASQAAEGWALVSAMATMEKASASRSVEGKFERRDGIREVEADDMAALEAMVPDGWRMLSVRRE